MDFAKLSNLLVEMPVNNVKLLGGDDSWEKRKSFDKGSFEDLKNPQFESTVKAAFKTEEDFSFYFLNDSRFTKDDSDDYMAEVGEVGPEHKFWQLSGLDYNDFVSDYDISIIFLGNYGSELVKLTPWVLAHRIGHAFRASRDNYGIQETFKQMEDMLKDMLNWILEDYGIKLKLRNFPSYGDEVKYVRPILEALGKFKSAREHKLSRPYEFLYECFAQYLITGEVKFNEDLKDIKIDLGDEYEKDIKVYKYNSADGIDIDGYGRGMEHISDDIMRSAIGSVFLM